MNGRLERWEQLADAQACEAELSAEQEAWLDDFGEDECDEPDAEVERAFYARMQALGEPGPLVAADFERAQETLAEFQAVPAARASAKQGAKPGAVWLWPAVVAVVGLAAAAMLWVAVPPTPALRATAQQSSPLLTHGSLFVDSVELSTGSALPVERWATSRGRACLRAGEASHCVHAQARVRASGGGLELGAGVLEFAGQGEVALALGTLHAVNARYELSVMGSETDITVFSGEVMFVDRSGTDRLLNAGRSRLSETWVQSTVRVEEGAEERVDGPAQESAAEVNEPSSDSTAVPGPKAAPGESRGGPSRARKQASAGELLAQARELVGKGRTRQALAVYARLERRYASSAEARAARVSVGRLELRRARYGAALRAFDGYLARGRGSLAEEAYWGRIRALHELKRSNARDAAIKTLAQYFPRSVYLKRAQSLK